MISLPVSSRYKANFTAGPAPEPLKLICKNDTKLNADGEQKNGAVGNTTVQQRTEVYTE
jgi:hypothetical protein